MTKNKILVVDDDQQMRSAMTEVLERADFSVTTAENGKEALQLLKESPFSTIVSDMRMPELGGNDLLASVKENYPNIPVVLITAYGTIEDAVQAMKLGAFDFITKPFDASALAQVVKRATSPASVPVKKQTKQSGAKSRAIITNDSSFKTLIEVATTVAKSDASVMIQGESGTGKELFARLIHSSSNRKGGPFVALNCAAVPDELLESELFGHEKGSFTGAANARAGKFEQASGGTLLLDEVTEMKPALQAKLLRVLQEQEVDRVGSTKPISVDVRVIATTNRSVLDAVKDGQFREDLYFRLNVIPLVLPPLRDRGSDIKLLSEYFIRRVDSSKLDSVNEQLLKGLRAYSWPGNVRELENACTRAVILSGGSALQLEHFLLGQEVLSDSTSDLSIKAGLTVAAAEKMLIFETLKQTENNKTKAAELLGISIRTLRNKLNEYEA